MSICLTGHSVDMKSLRDEWVRKCRNSLSVLSERCVEEFDSIVSDNDAYGTLDDEFYNVQLGAKQITDRFILQNT